MLNTIDYGPPMGLAWRPNTFTTFVSALGIQAIDPLRTEIIQFDTQHHARAILVPANTSPRDILIELNLLPLPQGVLTLCGGARDFSPHLTIPLFKLFAAAILPLASEQDLLLVDGGTKAGVMQIMGHAVTQERGRVHSQPGPAGLELKATHSRHGQLHLLGFAPAAQVTYPGHSQAFESQAPLDPHHPSFVLVTDVREWGDEVPCMSQFLNYLMTQKRLPVASVVVNGGRITIKEVWYAVHRGCPIILLEGSGRATDVMVAAHQGAARREMTALVDKWALTRNEQERQEILAWLGDIADYDKVTCFSFLTQHPSLLEQMLFSNLGF